MVRTLRRSRFLFIAPAVTGVLVLAGGCGGGGSGGPAAGAGGSATASPSAPASSAPEPSPPTATVTVTASPEPPSGGPSAASSPTPSKAHDSGGSEDCTSDQLQVTVRAVPGGGAAGSRYSQIVLTNVGDQPCRTGGFGGVSYVGHGNGTQVGAAAVRVDRRKAERFVLAPGDSAIQQLREIEAGNYPAGTCHPTPVDGLRVYPPNETHSLYAAHATTGCRSSSVKLLQISPYQPAS